MDHPNRSSSRGALPLGRKYANRLIWLLLPMALMIIFAFGTRYLIEHTDGPHRLKLLRHSTTHARTNLPLSFCCAARPGA
jgi:hypothetical protein